MPSTKGRKLLTKCILSIGVRSIRNRPTESEKKKPLDSASYTTTAICSYFVKSVHPFISVVISNYQSSERKLLENLITHNRRMQSCYGNRYGKCSERLARGGIFEMTVTCKEYYNNCIIFVIIVL